MNCLNFGNPEHPEVMWQFAEVVDGMSDACRALGIPVVGGNVSFYNESRGRDIDPTPVVGVVGVIDELTSVPPAPELHDGDAIVVLGHDRAELGGSEWATVHDLRGGLPPSADLEAAVALHDFVRDGRARPRGPRRARLLRRRARGRAGGDGDRGRVRRATSRSTQRAASRARVVLGVDVARRGGGRPALTADALVAPSPRRRRARATPRRRRRRPHRGRRTEGAFAVTLADATTAWRDAIPNALHPERASQS